MTSIEFLEKHDIQWYKDRIGKRVYRTESTCKCSICARVFEVGLIITGELHAHYLFDCQNEMGLFYFDKKD
jgi:hypothetical protein